MTELPWIFTFFHTTPRAATGALQMEARHHGEGPRALEAKLDPHCLTTASQARINSRRAPGRSCSGWGRPLGPPYSSQRPRCLIAPFWVLARENRKQNRWPMLAWATLGGSPSRVYIEKVYRRPLSTFRSGGEQTFARAPAVSLKGCVAATTRGLVSDSGGAVFSRSQTVEESPVSTGDFRADDC